MGNKVCIIGAGVAGLSAGCYLQMNGYETEIFELHNIAGGLCTSWKRDGYTIDGCIQWLMGSGPSNNFYYLWDELIDMENIKYVEHEEYIRVEDRDGEILRVFTDIDKLEVEMLEKAPEDKDLIIEFTNAVRKFAKFDLPIEKPPQLFNLFDWVKMTLKLIPFRGAFKKWARICVQEYADKCRNPLLKKTFEFMFVPETTALFVIFMLASMHKKSAGYPVGGSMKFANLIAGKYLELGGKINYKSKVVRVITENNTATGIKLENGDEHYADIVISAADGHYTIFEMLQGKYLNDRIQECYNTYLTFPSYVQVSLGVSRTFENTPHSLVFPLKKTLFIDESSRHEFIKVRILNYDPTLSPEGKTVIITMFHTTHYEYWERLRRENKGKYKSEKNRIAEEVIEILDEKFKNIKRNVEVVDVATASDIIKYTNNWKGSLEGWIMTPEIVMKKMDKTLPGLNNFYMAGQWFEPGGGLPVALMSGRNIAQIICKKDKKKFISYKESTP